MDECEGRACMHTARQRRLHCAVPKRKGRTTDGHEIDSGCQICLPLAEVLSPLQQPQPVDGSAFLHFISDYPRMPCPLN